MNKSKWIILISVVVVTVLAAVLLFAMLSGGVGKNDGSGQNNTDSGLINSDPDTTPSDTTPDTNIDDEDVVADGEIQIEIDTGDYTEENTEEIDENMVIDFDDLLAAAGK